MKKFKWSILLSVLEQVTYVLPTLGTTLFYYITTISESISKSSQFTFLLSIVLLVVFIVYRAIMRRKIEELRQATVHEETELKNTAEKDVDRREKLAGNVLKDRRKLDLYDRGTLMLGLLIFALSVRILEKAMIGLTTLALIACGSVLTGFGIHLGVLALRKREVLGGRK